MGRPRTKIVKIEDTAARQVSFSKRRRGLVKKAKELSILCDAEVGLVVFSSTGRLTEFASSSVEQIFERYNRNSNPKAPQKREQRTEEGLSKELSDARMQLRLMRGEELQSLSAEQLQQLETSLGTAMSRVLKRKNEMIMETIPRLQPENVQQLEENPRLKDKPLFMSIPEEPTAVEQQPSAYVANAAYPRCAVPALNCGGNPDTSLRLKLSLGWN